MTVKPILLSMLLIAVFTPLNFAQTSVEATQQVDDRWIEMFNGKNLDGWTPKIRGYELGENYANTFRVEDGLLRVRYDQYEGDFGGRFGHLFYETEFSNYIMELEYRFHGEQATGGPGWATQNSGIMVHGQDPATMLVDQDFPVSIEVQLLGDAGQANRPTLNLCTPGTNVEMNGELFKRHCTNSSSKTYPGTEWVKCSIEVRGNEVIRHKIGDEVVLEYQKPQLDPRDASAQRLIENDQLQLSGGTISLQSESHGVEFRNVRIKEIEN